MNAQELLGLQETYLGLYDEVLNESILDGFDDAHKKLMRQDLEGQQRRLEIVRKMKKMASSVVDDSQQKPSKSSSEPKMTPRQRLEKMKEIIDKELEHDDTNESYDLIISYLLNEGYANTPEAAQVILDNMSEGWKSELVKGALKAVSRGAKRTAKKAKREAKKSVKNPVKATVKRATKRAGRFALGTLGGALLGLPL